MTSVLVVDDDPEVNALVAYRLKQSGYEVTTATDGPGALDLLGRWRPDVLLLDIMMPDMSGLEVLQRVRADESLATLPVIMLTAKAQEDDVERGFEMGADDYITKPFSPRELISRVRAVLVRSGR